MRKVNSYSVPEGDYVEEHEMGREYRTLGGEEKDIQDIWVENLKVWNCMDKLGVDGKFIIQLIKKTILEDLDWVHLAHDIDNDQGCLCRGNVLSVL